MVALVLATLAAATTSRARSQTLQLMETMPSLVPNDAAVHTQYDGLCRSVDRVAQWLGKTGRECD